jgi:hypothetical protein
MLPWRLPEAWLVVASEQTGADADGFGKPRAAAKKL